MQNEIKVNDEFILHSSNGCDYQIIIYNVNYYRPPDKTFATLFYNEKNEIIPGGINDDFWFIGEDFFTINKEKIEKVSK